MLPAPDSQADHAQRLLPLALALERGVPGLKLLRRAPRVGGGHALDRGRVFQAAPGRAGVCRTVAAGRTGIGLRRRCGG